MKFKHALVILAMTLFSGSLLAQVKSVEVEGRGVNQKAAVQDALIMALMATKGVDIEANSVAESEFTKVMTDIATQCEAESSLSENIKTATQGYISSFEFIGKPEHTATGEVVVQVRAFVLEYDASNPNPGGRPRLVVFPFDFGGAKVAGPNKSVLADEMSVMLTSKLEEIGYFTVIEGARISTALQTELNYSAANGVDQAMRAKMGNLLSADYAVTGTITELIVSDTVLGVSKASVSFRGSMKITNVVTGERVGATSVFMFSKQGQELLGVIDPRMDLVTESSTLCMMKSTDHFSGHVASTLGPAKVVSVKKSRRGRGKSAPSWTFTIDNTSGVIKAGKIYDVFIQEMVNYGGVLVPEMTEDLLSIKIDKADGNFATGKMMLIGDEDLEDFEETLKDLQSIIETNNPSESIVAKRR